MSWQEITLGGHFTIKHGFAFKGEHFVDDGIHVVLTPGNFYEPGGFRARPGKDRYYGIEPPDDFILKSGDLVIAMTEQGEGLLGSSALIPQQGSYLHNQRIGLIENLNAKSLDKNFLYHLFNTRAVRAQIRASATGGKVRHTAPKRIYAIKVRVPDVREQSRIAGVISAYDDLVESNRRRIALLERAARMLYREWFVQFRFPGHEHTKVVNGIPEGWEQTKASAVMDVLSGGTPKTDNPAYWGGDIGFFTPKDATETPFVLVTEKTITEEGLRSCNSPLYAANTIFITARGTVGKLNLAAVPMAMNQSCYALQARADLGQRFLFLALKAAVEEFRARATGAVFNAVVVATFDQIPFLRPDEKIARMFLGYVDPMFDQIANLVQQNKKLAQARDLLLPRLMNGEIAV
jgi:type I restriction enzyme S subunit